MFIKVLLSVLYLSDKKYNMHTLKVLELNEINHTTKKGTKRGKEKERELIHTLVAYLPN
jgi:hypothetical protein